MNAYIILFAVAMVLIPRTVQINGPGDERINRTKAREHYNKGLLLLHNFEYVDAAEEFRAAQAEDPDLVLAYWGEAMTCDHPIWNELNLDVARATLAKLGESRDARISKGETPLEKDFIQSVEILFGEGSRPERQKAYSEFLGTLRKKYPDNDDVAAFYALSLLALKTGWEKWEDYNTRAEEITKAILTRNPDHAGALHYRVHANDHPVYAQQGLISADRYARIASYAGHALHMPSHIYLALGRWDDVVRSNEVSWQAGVDRKVQKELDNDQLNYHAHLWLAYGYLQQGRFDLAAKLIADQEQYTKELPSPRARYHLFAMKGHYLFNTNRWTGPIAKMQVDLTNVDASTDYSNTFVDGYALFHSRDERALDALVNQFEATLSKDKKLQKENETAPVCGVSRYNNKVPGVREIRHGFAHLNQLKGLQAWLNNDNEPADKFFKESLPPTGSVVVGPPGFLISPHELYGNFLLQTGRPAQALEQFNLALAASPERILALKGKLNSAQALNDKKTASETLTRLKAILKNADAGVADTFIR